MHLFGVHAALPGVDNDVVHLQVAQAGRIKAQVQVHEGAVQRRPLNTTPTYYDAPTIVGLHNTENNHKSW